jgi:MFS transporter, NNP family, nitrate/nitrite transporter
MASVPTKTHCPYCFHRRSGRAARLPNRVRGSLAGIAEPAAGWTARRPTGWREDHLVVLRRDGRGQILVVAGTRNDAQHGKLSSGIMLSYVVGFILLFLISGVGNGSVYKMIPAIFAAKSLDLSGYSAADARAWERAMSGALIGIAGAIGALGGVFFNVVLRTSYAGPAKSATTAFWVFLVFYLICVAVTWAAYVRRRDATSLV